jgi:hypothetical protein
MNLRRSREEISSGCGAIASVGDDSTGDLAAACSKAPYEAPYKAKPSMKNVNIDDRDAVFLAISSRHRWHDRRRLLHLLVCSSAVIAQVEA